MWQKWMWLDAIDNMCVSLQPLSKHAVPRPHINMPIVRAGSDELVRSAGEGYALDRTIVAVACAHAYMVTSRHKGLPRASTNIWDYSQLKTCESI